MLTLAADIHTQSRKTFEFSGGLFLRCKPRAAGYCGVEEMDAPAPKGATMGYLDEGLLALSRRGHNY